MRSFGKTAERKAVMFVQTTRNSRIGSIKSFESPLTIDSHSRTVSWFSHSKRALWLLSPDRRPNVRCASGATLFVGLVAD